MSLDSKTNKFFITIDLPHGRKAFNTELIQTTCNELFKEYSFIIHDKDVKESGEMKHVHLHIVARGNRQRLVTIINKLGSYLDIDNNLIWCKKAQSYVGSLQYLIHKNDKEKTQYNVSSIVSTINPDDLETMINSDNEDVSLDRLIEIILDAHCLTDVIRALGLSHYMAYRNVIIDIWRDKKEQNISPHNRA